MKIIVADKSSSLKINSYVLKLQELSDVIISTKKNLVTYHVYFRTSDQHKFMPDVVIKDAITYDEVKLNRSCLVYTEGKEIDAIFISCRYDSHKAKYLGIITHTLAAEQSVENSVSKTYEPIKSLNSLIALGAGSKEPSVKEDISSHKDHIDIDVEKANNLDI